MDQLGMGAFATLQLTLIDVLGTVVWGVTGES